MKIAVKPRPQGKQVKTKQGFPFEFAVKNYRVTVVFSRNSNAPDLESVLARVLSNR